MDSSGGLWEAPDWHDFEVLDCGDGLKLERWGQWRLSRPDPSVLWPPRDTKAWGTWQGKYHRSKEGGGSWERKKALPVEWSVVWRELRFKVKPTDFKHTGVFPEQAANWAWMMERLEGGLKLLNLFGYTGAATCAAAKAGAAVTHVDASKGMVEWCKENAALCGLSEAPIRTLVDDCQKFVEREARRGSLYDALILDPPSFGRGKSGESWKLEKDLWPLLEAAAKILKPEVRFVILNSYTTGLSALALAQILGRMMEGREGRVTSGELALKVTSGGYLPCGTAARWERSGS